MKKYDLFKALITQKGIYPTPEELVYKHGFSYDETYALVGEKVKDARFTKLPLSDGQDHPLFYWTDSSFTNRLVDCDTLLKMNLNQTLSDGQLQDMKRAFLLSEIESSLAIEGVVSTRAHIEKISQTDAGSIHNQNDLIIKNMLSGYFFIQEHPINESTIAELYQVLTHQSLKKEDQLREGQFYRHDDVSILDANQNEIDRGVPFQLLPKLMKNLLDYIKQKKSFKDHLIAAHVIHFYMIYLHPYFDYNGRMARVLSYWYSLQFIPSTSLLLVSESIRYPKHKNIYYQAIRHTRNMGNDLTYFLDAISSMMMVFSKVYLNLVQIQKTLSTKGKILNRSDELILKDLLIMHHFHQGLFTWKDYQSADQTSYSKQYILRMLNRLVELGILTSKEEKKIKFFEFYTTKWNLF